MASKHKLEIEDFESVNKPADNASLHAVVSESRLLRKDATVNFLRAVYTMVNQPCT